MKTRIVLILLMALVSGCYRPSWHRENTTYAVLRTDSEWCKAQTNIGATRSQIIEQYEKCMRNKGYQLKNQVEVSVEQPPAKSAEDGDGIIIDQHTKVYVSFSNPSGIGAGGISSPTYKYFHKKDCRQLWNVTIKEVTVGEAMAEGKSMCPYCFR